ncbi:soluble epoxide hydrolase [Corynespora cassiicola Philippines]|uniref:Soluble epoxide hydrolase n=1 Tax=Corynespora cassiicola Philippines TaxID=1448308 RepID=A0A2T2NY81_CORCC|nr:soluble epoxide hydrolase [Corynespora cassiicola Philippines]
MTPPPYDSSRWQTRIATLTPSPIETLRLNYTLCPPPPSTPSKGTILLIHGFPQTSHQFRHVITPLADAGYTILAPDYRGAGQSSKPPTGYTKFQMAADLHFLLTSHLQLHAKVHVVGHDIGGMIAWAYAARYPEHVASLIWGECPLPGTSFYEEIKGSADVFHFVFHQVRDLPEALVAGKEREYLKHFFDKLVYNSAAIGVEDLERYVLAYEQPGAMRAGFEVYRAFEQDAEENRRWLEDNGKVKVPVMGMVGKQFLLARHMEGMMAEVHDSTDVLVVEESGHYIAEEDPEAFLKGVLGFVSKYAGGLR